MRFPIDMVVGRIISFANILLRTIAAMVNTRNGMPRRVSFSPIIRPYAIGLSILVIWNRYPETKMNSGMWNEYTNLYSQYTTSGGVLPCAMESNGAWPTTTHNIAHPCRMRSQFSLFRVTAVISYGLFFMNDAGFPAHIS